MVGLTDLTINLWLGRRPRGLLSASYSTKEQDQRSEIEEQTAVRILHSKPKSTAKKSLIGISHKYWTKYAPFHTRRPSTDVQGSFEKLVLSEVRQYVRDSGNVPVEIGRGSSLLFH